MSLDPELLAILACPLCHGALESRREGDELACPACRKAWPVREDIPDLLPESGVDLAES